jgi:hypothetical protein
MNRIFAVLAIFTLTLSSSAWSKDLFVEVGVAHVFIPDLGFDDNDNVEAVLDGLLPNACYTLAETTVERFEGNLIRIRQFAYKKVEGVCLQEEGLAEFQKIPVPYSKEVSLGQLEYGDYNVIFSNQGMPLARAFNVAMAPVSTVDTMAYAPVTDTYISAAVGEGAPARAVLTGYLTSSCMNLREDFIIERHGDVVVILPQVEISSDTMCLFYIRPFERVVDLGAFERGRYLLHVRSMNGKSVNRVFSAIEAQ